MHIVGSSLVLLEPSVTHTHTHGSCSLAGFGSLGSENREGNNEELLKREEEEERLAHFTRVVFVKCHNGENL